MSQKAATKKAKTTIKAPFPGSGVVVTKTDSAVKGWKAAKIKMHGNVLAPTYVPSVKPGVKVTYGSSKPSNLKLKESGLMVLEPTAITEEAELAEKLISDVADSGSDVNTLCETYKLRREELGRLTGFSLRALAEWAAGKLPSQPAKRRLHEVRRLLDALAEIVKPESIPRWLHQPNPAFDRLTPLQVIEVGEIDRLWAMVHDLGSGQPT